MYEIGQQVVCVESHPMGDVKEGQVYTVKSLSLCKCCGNLIIDIGLNADNTLVRCVMCNHIFETNGITYFAAKRFRPLDDLYNTEIEELMNDVNEKQPFEV